MMHKNDRSFVGHTTHFPRKKYSLLIILPILLSLLAVWGMVSAETTTTQKATDATDSTIWTNWGTTTYALANDGDTLWIGTVGSIIKWDKATQTYERIGTNDGLPHRQIYAIAVDNAGNRWFGGDAGLSKLDFEDNWTHYTDTNSGLYDNRVDAIAVNSEGTLWLRHGSADNWITEFTFEEAWFVHPDRESAIVAGYDRISQTLNKNSLWAIEGTHIWAGYKTYNGASWQNNTPAGFVTPPQDITADNKGNVWAVPGSLESDGSLYRWDSAEWKKYTSGWIGGVTHVAVETDGTIRTGLYTASTTNTPYFARIGEVDPELNSVAISTLPLEMTGPIGDMLITNDGLWAVGSGWLVTPDGTLHPLPDAPSYTRVSRLAVDSAGLPWVHSNDHNQNPINIEQGMLQTIDDGKTASLNDDVWTQHTSLLLQTVEASPDGDMWRSGVTRNSDPQTGLVQRYHNGIWIDYSPGYDFYALDIFFESADHIWFAAAQPTATSTYPHPTLGILELDTNQTPTEMSDDTWTLHALNSSTDITAVAVDHISNVWYANATDLYQLGSSIHYQFTDTMIEDIVPAPDGTLIVGQPGYRPMIVWPDGTTDAVWFNQLAQTHADLLWSITEPNKLFSLDSNSSLWFTAPVFSNGSKSWYLYRRSNDLQRYSLPNPSEQPIHAPILDKYDHVWIPRGDRLWRMSPEPTFSLHSKNWFIQPGQVKDQPFVIGSIEGYIQPVSLVATDVPEGLSVTVPDKPAPVGELLNIVVSAETTLAPGTYTFTLSGSADRELATSITIYVGDTAGDVLMPIIAH